MSSIWERFEGIATPEEVNEVIAKKKEFAPIPAGTYEMILEELVAGEDKVGLPRMNSKWRIVDNNRVVFYNIGLQVLGYENLTKSNIADAVAFVSAIKGEDIEFTTIVALDEEMQKVNETKVGDIYKIRLYYAKKDMEEMKYPKLQIVKKDVPTAELEDDDTPF